MLAVPQYNPPSNVDNLSKIGLAVESMKRHTTDEGWQLFDGLSRSGYTLCGHGLLIDKTNVPNILELTNPGVVVVQDKREWDVKPGDFRDPRARFNEMSCLAGRHDVFKVTVLKDAHSDATLHQGIAQEVGCHAWIVYYDPKKVVKLAPYIRPEHLVRTWHSLDPSPIERMYLTTLRRGCLLSGASSRAYPMRQRLMDDFNKLPDCDCTPHPGYHRNGSDTPAFLRKLTQYKVAICTASVYDYSLRKMIEATACGCVVVTNYSTDDPLPEIDGNLVRIDSGTSIEDVGALLQHLYDEYDPNRQREFAIRAQEHYNYRAVGNRLAADIEKMRRTYTCSN